MSTNNEYRILETFRGFEVQRDIGHKVSWRTPLGMDARWKEEWLTVSIEKTLNKAKKEIHRLLIINKGIIYDN